MVDAGLELLCTRIAGAHDTDQVPDTELVFEHQRTAGVTLCADRKAINLGITRLRLNLYCCCFF